MNKLNTETKTVETKIVAETTPVKVTTFDPSIKPTTTYLKSTDAKFWASGAVASKKATPAVEYVAPVAAVKEVKEVKEVEEVKAVKEVKDEKGVVITPAVKAVKGVKGVVGVKAVKAIKEVKAKPATEGNPGCVKFHVIGSSIANLIEAQARLASYSPDFAPKAGTESKYKKHSATKVDEFYFEILVHENLVETVRKAFKNEVKGVEGFNKVAVDAEKAKKAEAKAIKDAEAKAKKEEEKAEAQNKKEAEARAKDVIAKVKADAKAKEVKPEVKPVVKA